MLSSLAGAVAAGGGTLGVLPAGRGNDFARMLGLPDDPPRPRPTLFLAGADAAGRPDRPATAAGATGWSPVRSTPGWTPAPPRSSTGRDWLPGRRCSTPTRRSARSRPTAPAATGSSVDGDDPRVRRGDRRGRELGATTARGCRSRPPRRSPTACSTWSSSRPRRRLELMRALPRVYDGSHVERDEVTVLTGRRVELAAAPAARSRSAATASRSASCPVRRRAAGRRGGPPRRAHRPRHLTGAVGVDAGRGEQPVLTVFAITSLAR